MAFHSHFVCLTTNVAAVSSGLWVGFFDLGCQELGRFDHPWANSWFVFLLPAPQSSQNVTRPLRQSTHSRQQGRCVGDAPSPSSEPQAGARGELGTQSPGLLPFTPHSFRFIIMVDAVIVVDKGQPPGKSCWLTYLTSNKVRIPGTCET